MSDEVKPRPAGEHPPRPVTLRTAVGLIANLRDKHGNPIRTADAVVRTALRGGVLAALVIMGGAKVGAWGDTVLRMLDRHLERQSTAIENLTQAQHDATSTFLDAHRDLRDLMVRTFGERPPPPRRVRIQPEGERR